MKLKDIVNRSVVNLTNCESEPIHIPGAIQPHGFLLGLKTEGLLIDYCSANSADYCGSSHEQLLGRKFGQAFGPDEAEKLRIYLAGDEFRDGIPTALVLGTISYSCTIRRADGHYLLEAEPFPDGLRNLPDLYRQTRRFVSLLERSQTLKALCQTITEETRQITGYDRVMVYRFDKDYNGEVIAESRREDIEPFLHLHYPHTDIPAQARELYLRNLLRMIVDIEYAPVPIYTIDDAPAKMLDLSHSVLRSVSPIHIEYLRNMGVGATLTISLIHEKKLWGLIACHHYAPKNLPHYTRLSAQLQGHFLTSQIAVREVSEAFEAGQHISVALAALLQRAMYVEAETIADLIAQPQLLRIADATGVVMKFNGRRYAQGEVPGLADSDDLGLWLAAHGTAGTYVTQKLEEGYTGACAADTRAAGVLYHALSADGANYIIWFRKEIKTEVLWAGDPSKAMVKDASGLSPRKSFEQWKELTTLQSKSWTDAEETAAANFTHALQKQLSLILLGAEEQRYRRLSEQLQQANAELQSINWISTHDLQEPLRKIQVFASRALDSDKAAETDPGIMHAVERMSDAANRMQALVNDIHAFSRLSHDQIMLAPVPLEEIVGAVVKDLSEEIKEKNAGICCDFLPQVFGERFLLRQLFVNLFRNALKFSRPGVKPAIAVTGSLTSGESTPDTQGAGAAFYKISVRDNGIGFSNEYSESIFGLFKRLHTQQEYAGTGIGLAICRKIMHRHNGFLTADAVEQEGAAFHLWFPADSRLGIQP